MQTSKLSESNGRLLSGSRYAGAGEKVNNRGLKKGRPRRFKTAFIFYSIEKHKEFREQVALGAPKKEMGDIAKMIGESWRNMSSQDRAIWDDMAAKDKERWEIEKMLSGLSESCQEASRAVRPNKKQDVPRAAPPPTRPSSAYFSFMKLKLGQVIQGNPFLSPAEVTRIASQMWHDLTFSERGLYLQQEARAMEVYNIAMKKWQDGYSQGTLVRPQLKENGLQLWTLAGPSSSPKKKRRRITPPPAKKTVTQSHCLRNEIVDVNAEQTDVPDRVPVPDGLLSSGEVKPQKRKITVTAKSLRLRNRKRQREQHKMCLEEVDTKPLSSVKQAEKSKPSLLHR